ncbi:MAG: 3'-5' exonuclease [Alphaproteobacteria bacterium]|nr:3'-5' exonuclease [Alphaproteobacteria bacterium]
MNKYSHYKNELNEIVNTNVNQSDWKLIRKLNLPKQYNEPSTGEIKKGVVLDVEATGLSIGHDDVIQLALLPFEYEVPSGKILSIKKEEAFDGLREPRIPISIEASLITGITNEMVINKKIESKDVENIINNTDLIIAHNASYDRPMVEQHWNCFKNVSWACTFKSIDWLQEGFSSAKLELLGVNFGWFYEGHDAFNDCEACLALLSETLPNRDSTVFSAVREYASNPTFLIKAIDAPYNKRNILRRKGYKWRPADQLNGKVWWTETKNYEEEVKWLHEEIYNRKINIPIKQISALNRYSDRIWE